MKETSEVAGGAQRMIRAVGERIADTHELAYLERLEAAIVSARAVAVESLREAGYTDVAIGEELGMSRQAVQQRWPRARRVVGNGARVGSYGAH